MYFLLCILAVFQLVQTAPTLQYTAIDRVTCTENTLSCRQDSTKSSDAVPAPAPSLHTKLGRFVTAPWSKRGTIVQRQSNETATNSPDGSFRQSNGTTLASNQTTIVITPIKARAILPPVQAPWANSRITVHPRRRANGA